MGDLVEVSEGKEGSIGDELREFTRLFRDFQENSSNVGFAASQNRHVGDRADLERVKGANLGLARSREALKEFKNEHGLETSTKEAMGKAIRLPDGSCKVLEKPKVYKKGQVIQLEEWRDATERERFYLEHPNTL